MTGKKRGLRGRMVSDAVSMYVKSLETSSGFTKEQRHYLSVLSQIQGNRVVLFDEIEGGIIGNVYVLIPDCIETKSNVIAVPRLMVTDVKETRDLVPIPIDKNCSYPNMPDAWWSLENKNAVRVLTAFNDGFMAFVDRKAA